MSKLFFVKINCLQYNNEGRKELFMDLVKKSISTWIKAAIVLTIGILVIVMGALLGKEGSAEAAEAISIVLGIVLLIVGSLALVFAVVSGVLNKTSFAAAGILAGLVLAFGISLVVGKYAAGLITLLVYIIPFLLIVLGAIIIGDSVFTMVLAIKAKGKFIAQIVAIVIGVIALVLGCLCVGNDPVIPQQAQLIVFGIVLVIYAALMVLGTFFKLPVAVVVVQEKEEKAE